MHEGLCISPFSGKYNLYWGCRSVCGRAGIPFSFLQDRSQKGGQDVCRLPVVLCAGVLPAPTVSGVVLGSSSR